jgi:hypothetical protein
VRYRRRTYTQRRARTLNAIRRAAAAVLLACLSACAGGRTSTLAAPLPDGWRLVQKGDFQALYDPDGKLVRLLHDTKGRGVADAVILYGAGGQPERAELDTNGDGRVDQWEVFRPDGTLDHREIDDDGDGRPDRRE